MLKVLHQCASDCRYRTWKAYLDNYDHCDFWKHVITYFGIVKNEICTKYRVEIAYLYDEPTKEEITDINKQIAQKIENDDFTPINTVPNSVKLVTTTRDKSDKNCTKYKTFNYNSIRISDVLEKR